MSVVIFLGPSLKEQQARAVLDADYRPPVSQGDVFRAVEEGAQVIGIVDGYFERVPAVWHKEILWAMSKGVHVYGASSMGALRASELYHYGMVGVGKVFEAFRDDRLEDDDEVTVTHGPRELGYPSTSDAMVNIRATLKQALDQGVIGEATLSGLIGVAKAIYYPHRSYQALLKAARESSLPADELTALEAWLSKGKVDQKGDDAVAMLDLIGQELDTGLAPKQVGFHFENTDAWEQASRRTGRQIAAAIPDDLPMDLILEELRLDGAAYAKTMGVAFSRALALREAERQNATVDRERFRAVLNSFFIQRGLTTPDAISTWLQDQKLDADGLTEMIQRELKVGLVETLFRDEIMAQLPDSLRVGGVYGDVVRRSEEKKQWLADFGLENVSVDACNCSEEELLAWHFSERRGQPVPKDLDTYAQSLGLGNRFDFLQAVAREYLFANR